jgi:hypothetical protein
MDQRRHIGRVRVAVADESFGGRALIDGGLENPTVRDRIGYTLL